MSTEASTPDKQKLEDEIRALKEKLAKIESSGESGPTFSSMHEVDQKHEDKSVEESKEAARLELERKDLAQRQLERELREKRDRDEMEKKKLHPLFQNSQFRRKPKIAALVNVGLHPTPANHGSHRIHPNFEFFVGLSLPTDKYNEVLCIHVSGILCLGLALAPCCGLCIAGGMALNLTRNDWGVSYLDYGAVVYFPNAVDPTNEDNFAAYIHGGLKKTTMGASSDPLERSSHVGMLNRIRLINEVMDQDMRNKKAILTHVHVITMLKGDLANMRWDIDPMNLFWTKAMKSVQLFTELIAVPDE